MPEWLNRVALIGATTSRSDAARTADHTV